MLGFTFNFLNEFREFHGEAAMYPTTPLNIKAAAIRGDNQADKILVAPESIFVFYQITDFHSCTFLRHARLLARFLRLGCFPALAARKSIARATGSRFLSRRLRFIVSLTLYNHNSKGLGSGQGKNEGLGIYFLTR